ncbi:MAG: hypothetical protein NAG76_14835 [Candidatus Pristimantibacillus lignocellulolyticus]|uniref:Uncharacterized protein n=1 Tax=Candidatus Pristimantibacillus lignocellulolyticus TaxID=2994561 RepID=A0A9J6ZAY6_9BACL|nr:MAG: hypothetical protein NAG76_14835 [Candidatus Pristimantibacillus lignocellulolyticus]
MSLANDFMMYRDEIELIRAQNLVECDLYSIIACIIRERKQGNEISLRDVSVRRETDFSKRFRGNSGFPDFVIRTRDKTNNANILGAVEVKYVDEDLDLENHLEQLIGHLDFYKRVIYTNGLKWRYYVIDEIQENNVIWEIELGEIQNGKVLWYKEDKWTELLRKLDSIKWN